MREDTAENRRLLVLATKFYILATFSNLLSYTSFYLLAGIGIVGNAITPLCGLLIGILLGFWFRHSAKQYVLEKQNEQNQGLI
jgi:hypothetical protein